MSAEENSKNKDPE